MPGTSPNTVDFGEDLTDQQLFDDASAPPVPAEPEEQEPAPQEPIQPQPGPVETTGGRLKDPLTGKFVAKAERPGKADEELSASPEQPQEPQEPDAEPQMPAHVPSWRLAEEAQRRRDAEAQNYAAQQQLRQMQMQMAQWQDQMQKANQQPVDPITSPLEYQQALQAAVQQEIAGIRLESNLQFNQMKHGEQFDRAYEAFVENTYAGDAPTYNYVMGSPNVGEAIVRWYRDREIKSRIGDDPDEYINQEISRRMADPAFQAQVIQLIQSQNGSAPSNQQVKLPPSLSRVSSAAPAAEGEMDASDAAMYNYATGNKR